MARGTVSPIGAERQAPNGYYYRKTENDGWQLIHRLIAEEKLGRKLAENEYATFLDNDKTNLDPDNIIVRLRGRHSLNRRLAQVEARLVELTALRDDLVKRLATQQALDYREPSA
jgi:hypothetical protein